MDSTEGIKTSIKELKKAQAEKSKRIKAAVKEVQQGRHIQTEPQTRYQ